ncbi:MAG TPA: M23 family metallopeptidase [Lysobacter sp.]
MLTSHDCQPASSCTAPPGRRLRRGRPTGRRLGFLATVIALSMSHGVAATREPFAVPAHPATSGIASLALPPLPADRRDDARGIQPGAFSSPGDTDEWREDSMLIPVSTGLVTSGFGPRSDPFRRHAALHRGIDFAAARGTAVRASANGVVSRAAFSKDYGNLVMIDHGNGCSTLYAHNERLLVRVGDSILAGQPIASVGSTGRSTGPHLHFEVRQHGERVDPRRYLAGL